MSSPRYVIDIDRLILTDMDISPERAALLRSQVEMALQRQLAQTPLSRENIGNAPIRVPPISVAGAISDRQLASHIAQGIARSMGARRT